MDFCIAVIVSLHTNGPGVSYAIARSSRTDMEQVHFSLDADVWCERTLPLVGDAVLLAKIRKYEDQWIAKEASFWKAASS